MAQNNNNSIDGERKAVLRVVDTANYEYTGLVGRTQWEPFKKKGYVLVTQRALLGASLHVESLNGQLPNEGTIIPKALLKGRSGVFKGGDQMAQHLDTAKTARKAERGALKTINELHKLINV